jgi:hypothetical protein
MTAETGNFNDHTVIPLSRVEIAKYYDKPNGEGRPSALLLIAKPPEDFPKSLSDLMFVARFRNRDGAEKFIAALREQMNEVWPVD